MNTYQTCQLKKGCIRIVVLKRKIKPAHIKIGQKPAEAAPEVAEPAPGKIR